MKGLFDAMARGSGAEDFPGAVTIVNITLFYCFEGWPRARKNDNDRDRRNGKVANTDQPILTRFWMGDESDVRGADVKHRHQLSVCHRCVVIFFR